MSVPVAQDIANSSNSNKDDPEAENAKYKIIQAKSTNKSLKTISLAYGWSQVFNVVAGGFAITPSGKRQNVHFPLTIHCNQSISLTQHLWL